MRYLITGATGFIGRELISQIQKNGDAFELITRNAKKAEEIFPDADEIHQIDLTNQVPKGNIFKDIDVVINLAGEFVFGFWGWTKSKKASIYDSRVLLTRNLVNGINHSGNNSISMVSTSAVGYYTQSGNKKILDEVSGNGTQFLSNVCFDWENEAILAQGFGIDVSIVRLGVVLGRKGGVISTLYWPFILGLGVIFGRGKQWWSWVHVSDVVGLILFCAENRLKGIYNGVSVDPVMHKDFAQILAKTLNRRLYFKFPVFLLKLLLREMSSQLLNSYFVKPKATLDAGYQYKFKDLNDAMRNIFGVHLK